MSAGLPGGLWAQESRIDTPLDAVNAHFAVASEHFGDGIVQLHARRDGADGTRHTILHIDCVNRRANTVFQEAALPEQFPVGALSIPDSPLEADTENAALAQHACKEHGYTQMEW